ncbi:MAG: bifunctional hydroxymethylpyrimidine kinase/phosphomethylpyrimidine kinase [Solirubrobacterales bacterium]
MAEPRRVPVALAIAGSDSGGGAGIQADLKAFARAGVHGTTAITALTAQNTVGVEEVEGIGREMILAQVRAVASDIGVDSVKVGMLGTEGTIDAVVESLAIVPGAPVVVDPVMVAESGSVLLAPDARVALVQRLLPKATVVTPNVPEARELTGLGADSGQEELARGILALGPGAAIVTGGHTEDGADVLLEVGAEPVWIPGPRYPDGAAHGSGCTHSSTVAAMLAWGLGLEEAATSARQATADAVRSGLREIGEGAGPVDVLGLAGNRPEGRRP